MWTNKRGFGQGSEVDGVTEHTELLTNIMRDAKRHQRSLVVTLLDLKNAFGEVHHELIRAALSYHHVPSEFMSIFENIYSNFQVAIAVNGNWTQPIRIECGVLQGNPASPLIFNLCFNILMKTLSSPEYRSLGYRWGSSHRRSWLQFADDAAIVASTNSKTSQSLLDVFLAWCNWANMDLRLDKCCTFGMSKEKGKYRQTIPGLWVEGNAFLP